MQRVPKTRECLSLPHAAAAMHVSVSGQARSQLGLEGGHIDVNKFKSISPLGCLHGLNCLFLDLVDLRLVLQQPI